MDDAPEQQTDANPNWLRHTGKTAPGGENDLLSRAASPSRTLAERRHQRRLTRGTPDAVPASTPVPPRLGLPRTPPGAFTAPRRADDDTEFVVMPPVAARQLPRPDGRQTTERPTALLHAWLWQLRADERWPQQRQAAFAICGVLAAALIVFVTVLGAGAGWFAGFGLGVPSSRLGVARDATPVVNVSFTPGAATAVATTATAQATATALGDTGGGLTGGGSGPGPTPGVPGGSGGPSPQPTQGPPAPPNATAPPNPVATSAILSFTPRTQNASGTVTFTACVSSCPMRSATVSGICAANGSCVSSGSAAISVRGNASGLMSFYIGPKADDGAWTGTTSITGPYGNCGSFTLTATPSSQSMSCSLSALSVPAGGQAGCVATQDPFTGLIKETCWTNNASWTAPWIVQSGDCLNARAAAHNNIEARVPTLENSALAGRNVYDRTLSYDFNTEACNPTVGAAETFTSVVTGSASAGYAAWAFLPSDASSYGASQVSTKLPNGYYWSTSPACAVASYSGNGAGTATVVCNASGTATADLRAGSSARSVLLTDIAGRAESDALALCNANPLIVAGSCRVSLTPASASILPSASAISVS